MYVYPLTIGPGFSLGTAIKITVPVTSGSTIDVNTRLTLEVWEGRFWVGPYDIIATYSKEATIAPDATEIFAFDHTVVTGPNWGAGQYRRDIKAFLDYWNGSAWVRYGEYAWEDIYHAQAYYFEFTVGTPIVEAIPIGPGNGDVFSIGLYYLWHYPEDSPMNKNWLQEYSNGLNLGLGRLGAFMDQNDYARDIVYESAGELYTTAEIGKNLHMFGEPGTPESGILIDAVIDALSGLCAAPSYSGIIQHYDLVYVVLANMKDIFGPHGRDADSAHTRRSPIYIGGQIFPLAFLTGIPVIEMEFFVTCGVPELYVDPGEPTIMYGGYLWEHPGAIVLRDNEKALAKWSNWQKGEYGVDFCNQYIF